MNQAAAVVKNELDLRDEKSVLAAQMERKPVFIHESKRRNKPKRNEKGTQNDVNNRNEESCAYCTRTNHSIEDCYFRKNAEKLKKDTKSKVSATIVEKTCGIINRLTRDLWFLDSGSQSHTTNNRSGFVSLQEAAEITLESAGGDDIRVEGVGTYEVFARPNLTLELKDCIYAPGLIASFLSSGKLNKHGFDVLLRRDGVCLVYNDDEIVATGQMRNGMYEMNLGKRREQLPKNVIAVARHKSRTLMDWHRAMGHLNFTDLKRLLNNLGVRVKDDASVCKVCLLAKMTRTPHMPKNIKSTQPLDRIYTDLSGIIRTPSVQNFRYFLTFIDDYSRYTTVYLLKTKEEVYDKFMEFKAMAENQFGRKIKQLRSDNGTEYTNNRFRQAIKDSGIDHQFTEVETPQQNGVAERMNRTIGNGVRSVLIDSKMSPRFWPYAVRYIVQVRNASPNSSIGYECPYRLWKSKEPRMDRFYPFGCTAIAYNLNATEKMVDPRGIDCRFLMINTKKDGYVLLSNADHRIIESGDVKFLTQLAEVNTQGQPESDYNVDVFDFGEMEESQQQQERTTHRLVETMEEDVSNALQLDVGHNVEDEDTRQVPPIAQES